MEMTVLIEPINGRFKASTSQPVMMESEGASREEAIARLQELASTRLASGEILQVSVTRSDSEHPWMKFAGIWKDHPEFNQFVRNIKEQRECDDETKSES
ncbi:MAG: hypothetical protein JWM11_7494 [Planctomycetaceae bacterium]|nr:hypothetical protein [Planctomycetaceae bacterium]